MQVVFCARVAVNLLEESCFGHSLPYDQPMAQKTNE